MDLDLHKRTALAAREGKPSPILPPVVADFGAAVLGSAGGKVPWGLCYLWCSALRGRRGTPWIIPGWELGSACRDLAGWLSTAPAPALIKGSTSPIQQLWFPRWL